MIDVRQGDALQVLAGLPDNSIDLVLTDPPYGIDYCSGRQGVDRKTSITTRTDRVIRPCYFSGIANDKVVPVAWLSEVFRVLRPDSALYVFAHWRTWGQLAEAVVAAGFTLKNMIVLRKSNHGMGDLKGGYAPKHELLLYAAKGAHRLRCAPRQTDVWDVPVRFSGAKRAHPNEKPLAWLIPPILNSSDPDGIVLDPFCGSGTTGEAALRNGRCFVGCDIEPQWVTATLERLTPFLLETA